MSGQGTGGFGQTPGQGTGGSGQMSGQGTNVSGQGTGSSGQLSGQGTGGSGQGTGNSGDSGSAPADLGQIGQEAVSQAQEQAVKIVGQAREQVQATVKTQTARGSTIATVLGSTLHEAGKQLREQDETAAATYLDQAADQVEQISSMLDNQDYGQLIGTVRGFAQRQPVLFFAAAIAVGVVGTKFLKSSSPESQSSQRGPDAYAGLRNTQGEERRTGGFA